MYFAPSVLNPVDNIVDNIKPPLPRVLEGALLTNPVKKLIEIALVDDTHQT